MVVLLAACLWGAGAAGAMELAVGDIIVTDIGTEKLFRVDPLSGAVTEIAVSGLSNPYGVAVGESAKVYVLTIGSVGSATDQTTSVYRVDAETGERVTVFQDPDVDPSVFILPETLQSPRAMAFDPQGNLLIADPSPLVTIPVGDSQNVYQIQKSPTLHRLDLAGSTLVTVSAGGHFKFPAGVDVGPDGAIYVSDGAAVTEGPNKVLSVDPISGAQTIVASAGSLSVPREVAVDASGDLFVTDSGFPGVIRVSPSTYDPANPASNQSIVAVGGGFVTPIGIAIEADGKLVVADAGADKVFRVDPANPGMPPNVLATSASFGTLRGIDVVKQVPTCGPAASCGDEPVGEPDLGATLEIDPGHPEITRKAQELGSPLAIFKFVRNQIEYEVYFGSKKGALGTLRSRSGNDFDQASLVIALFRALDFRARYALGVVDVDVDQLMQWSGVRDPTTAGDLFRFQYCFNQAAFGLCGATPKRFELLPVGSSPPVSARMEHAWVEVELPARYRGLAVDDAPLTWIPLDPSWKQKDYRDPIALPIVNEVTTSCGDEDLCFPYDDYYSKVDPRLASEIWEQRVREWIGRQPELPPGLDAQAATYDGPIVPYRGELFPLALPFIPLSTPPIQTVSDLGALADGIERRFRLTIALSNPEVGLRQLAQVAFSEIVGKRFTLAFEPKFINGPGGAGEGEDDWIKFGGPFGSWPNGADSILEFCSASPGDSDCRVVESLRLSGRPISQDYPDWHIARPHTLHVLRDLIPGYAPAAIAEVLYDIHPTDFISIGLDANQSSEKEINHSVQELLRLHRDLVLVEEGSTDRNGNNIPDELLIDQGTSGISPCAFGYFSLGSCDIAFSSLYGGPADALIGELLHLATLRYSVRLHREWERVLALDGLVGQSTPNVWIAKAGRSYTYLFDQPVGVEPGAPIFDVRGSGPAPLDIDGDPVDSSRARRELRLLSHVASALEHQVWEELIGSEFVSTVKGIQLVRERYPNEPLQEFTNVLPSTVDAVLGSFGFDTLGSGTIDLIKAEADGLPAGTTETVFTPRAAVAAQGDRLEVFIAEKESPAFVSAQMAISLNGQVLGGSCSILGCVDPFTEILEEYGLSDVFSARETAQGFGFQDIDGAFPQFGDPALTSHFLAGDPVSVVSGNLYHSEEDLRIPTDGPPFLLTRTYNSQISSAGALGVGWTHSYEARVEPPQELQGFTYLPTSLAGFGNLTQVEGSRSDTGDTRSTAGGATEAISWSSLQGSAFASKVTVDSIAVEIGFNGDFSVTPGTLATVALRATDFSRPGFQRIELQTGGAAYVSLAALQASLGSFDGTDVVYFARLRIRYRGPAIRRINLSPSTFGGWPADHSALTDADPSTCVAPTSDLGTIDYTLPSVSEAFGHELLVSVKRAASGGPNSALYRGGTGGELFRTGPGVDGGVRERFMTASTTLEGTLTFDRDAATSGGSSSVELCHVAYRVLTLPEELDFVREDGARERFTKVGSVWQATPGVRSRLTEQALPLPRYKITRPDGSSLSFDQVGGTGPYRLLLVSDAQDRSLRVQYDGSNRLEKVIWLNSPIADVNLKEALEFYYDASKLDRVEDWTRRVWDYTVEAGDLVEARDPEESDPANNWTGTRYEYHSGVVLSGPVNPALAHNLRRIRLPKDADGDGAGDHWTQFEYDLADRVSSHTNSLGHRQTFTFNVPRQESRTTDARGFTTIYRHDLRGNLVERVDPDGATWTWVYDDDRNVVEERDPFGRKRVFSGHDELGNPAQTVDRDDREMSFTYHHLGPGGTGILTDKPATVTDKRGHDSTVQYSTDGLPETLSQELVTIDGQPPNVALLLENEYDPASRRLERMTRPLGDGTGRQGITVFSYFPGNRDVQAIKQWEDDGDGSLGASDRLLSSTRYIFDPVGRKETETVLRQTAPEDPTPPPVVTEWEYNGRDQVERIVHPDGTESIFVYDRNGELEEQYLREPRPTGPPRIHQRVQFRYDRIDRVVETENAFGGVTMREYDPAGNRTAETDPLGHRSEVVYDAMSRPVRVIDANGAVTVLEYDAMGRLITRIDPTGLTVRTGYNAIGRVISFQRGDDPEATRAMTYDLPVELAADSDYREVITDPSTNPTTFLFDAFGRVSSVIDARDGRTDTEYNLYGNVTRFVDPAGGETRFEYDALGRESESTRPYATGAVSSGYDELGNLIRITKADECQLEMTYDVMNRLKRRRFIAPEESECPASVGTIDDRFGYDARGNLVAAKNQHVGLIREYDGLDRLVREIDDRFGSSVGYLYDDASRLTGKVYPDGSVVHVAYDAAGRPSGITDPFGETTRYVYDAAGRRLQTRGTAGFRAELGYDANGRLESLESFRADGSIASSVGYPDYDHSGNREQRVNDDGATAYQYDQLHRLSRVTPPGQPTTHFQYDGAGNRTRSGNRNQFLIWTPPFINYAYETASGVTHRLTTVATDAGGVLHSFPQYDANGDPIEWNLGSAQRTLEWDALDRLIAIESSTFSGAYVYDPLGRRIEKTESGTTARYQYDGLDVVAEYNGSNTLQATYIFGPGIDEPLKVRRASTTAAFHTDGLGSVLAVSSVGSPSSDLRTYEYGAFGELESQSGTFANAYTYTGRERDDSGLYYYRARYYLPEVGRFLTPDPIGLAGGTNPYAYVGSNPVNFRDPFGLFGFGSFNAGIIENRTSPRLGTTQPAFQGIEPIALREGAGIAERALVEGLNAGLEAHRQLAGGTLDKLASCGRSPTCSFVASILTLGLGRSSSALSVSAEVVGARGIATSRGLVTQATSDAALAARAQVSEGATLWRMGTTGRSAAGEGQFWSLEHPLTPDFASRYGIPAENIKSWNFIESATLRPGTPFVTRQAPAVGQNLGGGIEVVVPEGGVVLRSFSHLGY